MSSIDTLMVDLGRHTNPAGTPDLPDVTALLLLCRAERARVGAGQAPEWAEVARSWEVLGRPYPVAYAYWREAEIAASNRTAGAEGAARMAYRLAESLGRPSGTEGHHCDDFSIASGDERGAGRRMVPIRADLYLV